MCSIWQFLLKLTEVVICFSSTLHNLKASFNDLKLVMESGKPKTHILIGRSCLAFLRKHPHLSTSLTVMFVYNSVNWTSDVHQPSVN